MSRQIIAFEIDRTRVVGTHHVPSAQIAPRTDVGVLILNAGAAPRSGNSDLAVHVGDKLAGLGIHAVRVDLPGLGDSFGESPIDLKTYWRQVRAGRNDAATVALMADVRNRFGIRSWVIGGLCAGSVTAIRVAAAGTPGIAGLILFEPEFRLWPMVGRASSSSKPGAAPAQRIEDEIPVPSPLKRKMYRVLDLLGVKRFPVDSNLPLVDAWLALLAKGLPSFVVVAEGLTSHGYIKLTQRKLSARARASLACTVVDRTNHILTSGDARRLTIAGVEQWMSGSIAATALSAITGDDSPGVNVSGLSKPLDSL